MKCRRIENHFSSGGRIWAVRGDDSRVGSGQFSFRLRQHLLPVIVQNQPAALEDCEVAVLGIVGHIALEEHGVVAERAKRADQGPPQYGVAVTPGGADGEAEDHQFHCDLGKLSRRGDPARRTTPEELLDITFESEGAVSCRVPGEHMFARPDREPPPLAVGKIAEVGEHLLR